jgi:YVTN family beta-propeller protein
MAVILTSVGQADWVTTTVAVGTTPYAAAVNPVTNKVYVANGDASTVTVIDGATNGTTTVPAGNLPYAVAVNPVTNKVYVCNNHGNNVTVIDGATNGTTTVATGNGPTEVAVNPVTNKIYVTDGASPYGVTVIDGATNGTTTIPTGTYDYAVGVNPVTNKIYVTLRAAGQVMVIDGANNGTTILPAGSDPCAVGVNPVTNKIYVANWWSASVTVIDGATNGTTTVAVGSQPWAVAVNPVTNKIYVSNYAGNSVTVIDGSNNGITTVAVGAYPYRLSVNPVTNKIYVANEGGNSVTVIDGATNGTTTVAVGAVPNLAAVNPVTNKVYVVNQSGNSVSVIDGATNGTVSVAAGTNPYWSAVNPVTNKIYVANYGGTSVTVIDGATNGVTTVAAGSTPYAVAVNPVTNKIYVANNASNNVTVIDGATNGTATVAAGTGPVGVAVNPVTNKIYVVNWTSNDVTVIDGATNATATVAAGTGTAAVAVNPATNKIYVSNSPGYSVTVIDGATNGTTTIAMGTNCGVSAVNPVTNKIYVTNGAINTVKVIDGATNGVTTVTVGTYPNAVAVNPVTNKIYVTNWGSSGSGNTVSVIDGVTNGVTTVTMSSTYLQSVAVNPVTNKVYVPGRNTNNVTLIDGVTNGVTTVATGTQPGFAVVNPVTNKVYIANYGTNNVTVITDVPENDTKVRAEVAPIPGNVAVQARPTISGKAVNRSTPNRPKMLNVGNRMNTAQQSWRWASVTSGGGSDSLTWSLNWSTDSLIRGENLICAEPLDSSTGTTNGLGQGTSFCGNLHVYPLYRVDGHDVGLTWIASTLDSAGPLVPACSVYNYGRFAETYSARMKIGGAYNQTASVSSHLPGTTVCVAFPSYCGPRGSPAVSCTTELDGDMWQLNDHRAGSASVRVNDVGVVSIVAPTGAILPGPLTPSAVVHNYGSWRGPVNATFFINSAPPYQQTVQLSNGLPVGADSMIVFPSWNGVWGNYTARCSTSLAGDRNPVNDTMSTAFRVAGLGWTKMTDLLPGGKSKNVKDGGALAYGKEPTDANDTGYVYAFKGNNRYEFYRYNTSSNAWVSRDSIPAIGRSLKKKAVKKGSALIVGTDGKVYGAKGNNTYDLWCYDPSKPSHQHWTQLNDVPTGGKALKEGTGLAAVSVSGTNYIYVLKGAGTYEFYRYKVSDGSWETMANAPGGNSTKPYKNGSSITYDNNDTIWCLKGSYNELFAYSVSGKDWVTKDTLPKRSPPGTKKTKVKDGSQIASDGNRTIYALKGGNTDEFWTYKCNDHTWYTATQLTAGSKKVKGGGGLVYAGSMHVLYAFRGNNTLEYWAYNPGTFALGPEPKDEGVLSTGLQNISGYKLNAAPNPFASRTAISYTLPKSGNVALRLYDISGQLVSTLVSGYRPAGSYSSQLTASSPQQKLAAGIYILRLDSEGNTTTQKLIIE